MRSGVITRRTVLGSAVVGGAAMAAARLVHAPELEAYRAPARTSGAVRRGLDWVSPLASDAAKVAQLLRRTAFGFGAADLERAAADGFRATVDRLIETSPAEPVALFGAEDAAQDRPLRLNQMQEWWLRWMLDSPTPFAEWLTLFWHDHFPSDYRKVGLQSPYLYWQNQTWRRMSLSDLRSFLIAVTVDPAMLRYLDLSTSTAQNPNENYSRELMELFAMGSGTFTEEDVKAAAKALAGWREPRTPAMVEAQIAAQIKRTGKAPAQRQHADPVKTGIFDARRAFWKPVSYLGKTARFDTEGVVDRILEQDVTAPFIARKVIAALVAPNPDEAFVKRVAESFRKSGYDLKTLFRDVLTSPEFAAPAAYRSLVKSPTEFTLHVLRALGAPQLVPLVMQSGPAMGQQLFDPPDVGGWPTNEAWISSSSLLARANFVSTALQRARSVATTEGSVQAHLDDVIGPQTAKLLSDAKNDREHWLVLLASPEFQLK